MHFPNKFLRLSANKKRIFSLVKGGVEPNYIFDGMTSDKDGNLYAATFGGSKIMKINPKYSNSNCSFSQYNYFEKKLGQEKFYWK